MTTKTKTVASNGKRSTRNVPTIYDIIAGRPALGDRKPITKTKSKPKAKPVKAYTVADHLDHCGGAGIGNWADRMIENDGKDATLRWLQSELELAADVLDQLIDELGEDALLSDNYERE